MPNILALESNNTEVFDKGINIGALNTPGGLRHWNGDIAEIIAYSKELNDTQRNKIESYLALKYGITINKDDSSNANYISSEGSIVWSSESNYRFNIFGIGRDDKTGLNQKVAKSTSASNSILTVATTDDFESSNLDENRIALNNNQFLIFGSNNDNNISLSSSGVDSSLNPPIEAVLNRVWKFQNTNGVSSAYLKFNGFDSKYVLLLDNDGDFSSGVSNIGKLNGNGEILFNDIPQNGYLTLGKVDFLKIIVDYANDSNNTAPSVDDYTNLGVTGVDASNLEAVNKAVDELKGEDVDTKEEVQALVDKVNALKAAIEKAKGDNNITEGDLTAAGVEGPFTTGELKVVKELLKTANPEPTTPGDLKTLVEKAKTQTGKIKELLDKAKGEGNVTEEDLTGITGIDGPFTGEELKTINELLDRVDPKPTTPGELKELIDEGKNLTNKIKELVKKAEENKDITNEDLTGCGVDGNLTDVELSILKIDLQNVNPKPTTPEELKDLINKAKERAKLLEPIVTEDNDNKKVVGYKTVDESSVIEFEKTLELDTKIEKTNTGMEVAVIETKANAETVECSEYKAYSEVYADGRVKTGYKGDANCVVADHTTTGAKAFERGTKVTVLKTTDEEKAKHAGSTTVIIDDIVISKDSSIEIGGK